MIEGRQAECGGTIVSKRADAPWPEGSFQEELGLWQREWFYITAPRSTKWVAPPAFPLGSPTTASVMGQQRVRLGFAQRRALVAGPH